MNSKQQLIQHCQQYLSHYDNHHYLRECSIKLVEWITKVVSGSIIVTSTDITTKIIEAEYTTMIWDRSSNPFNVRLFIQLISNIVDDSEDEDEDDEVQSPIVARNPYNSVRSYDGIPYTELVPLVPRYGIFLLKNSNGIIVKISDVEAYVGKLNSYYTIDPLTELDTLPYPIMTMCNSARMTMFNIIAENLDNKMITRIKANVTNPERFSFI